MKKTYILDGLCCAHCAAEIENNVKKMDGVDSAAVSFLTTKLVIETAEEPSEDMMMPVPLDVPLEVMEEIETTLSMTRL